MKLSVCGKGGSGKSVMTTLLALAAQKRGLSALVVDSDESNSGLFRMLGMKSPPAPLLELVGGKAKLKEKMRHPDIFNQSKVYIEDIPLRYLRNRGDLKLVSIGKILQSLEGCACPMGVLSREFLKKLCLGENALAVVDMEAGVEHFGRGIDQSIDSAVLVVEPSFESFMVTSKIQELSTGIKKKVFAVLNKMPSQITATKIEDKLRRKGLDVIGSVPNDSEIFEACLEGRPLASGEALFAVDKILAKLIAAHTFEKGTKAPICA
jgi:CO dehydrogenase maturation factor